MNKCADNAALPTLRARADDITSNNGSSVDSQAKPDVAKLLRHGVQVHPIEREIQDAELRLARSELEATRKRYLELFEHAPVAYFVIDGDSIIQRANAAASTLLGFAHGKLPGVHIGSFVVPEDGPVLSECIGKASATGTAVCHLAMAGAGLKPLYVRLEAVADAAEETCRLVVLDLTELKKRDDALQAAAAEIEDLYQHAPCGYHTLDARGYIRRINDTELSWLGYAREELLGKTMFQDLLSRAGRRDFAMVFAKNLRREGNLHDREWEIKCRNGRLLPILANAKVLRNAQGEILSSRWTVIGLGAKRERAEAHAPARPMEKLSRV